MIRKMPPRIVELKCWPEFYEPLHTDLKRFEVRFDDRAFKVGDILMLREFDPGKLAYTGKTRYCYRQVTYLTRDELFVLPGHVVMSLGMPSVDELRDAMEQHSRHFGVPS